jgi:5-methylcytosine-specific restriction protein A
MIIKGERIRGRAGMKLRRERLGREPLCRMCKARGKVTLATTPDHIKPLALGGTDTDNNIRCLCAGCHDKVTREEFGLRDAKQQIGLDGWPLLT